MKIYVSSTFENLREHRALASTDVVYEVPDPYVTVLSTSGVPP